MIASIFLLLFLTSLTILISKVEAQTPTVTVQNPQSGINFLPQKAYVTTLTPDGLPLQLQPVQTNDNNSAGTLESVVTAGVTSAIAYFAAKSQADKKHKENAAEILKGKEVTRDLAKVTYDMNPTEAAKITDAPLVKNETLASDATNYGQTVAKK